MSKQISFEVSTELNGKNRQKQTNDEYEGATRLVSSAAPYLLLIISFNDADLFCLSSNHDLPLVFRNHPEELTGANLLDLW